MNQNPQARRILCFGDSNTWGYIPGSSHERYPANLRWTGVLQGLLGDGFEILEEGLNSRTLESEDPRPGKEGRSAAEYILPCLDSHAPLDWVVLMLGTNELKADYVLSVEEVGEMLRTLVARIQSRGLGANVLVVSPPLVNELTPYCMQGGKYTGATKKSVDLLAVYRTVSEELGCGYLDVTDEMEVGEDGVHLTEAGHAALARQIAHILA